VRAERVPGTARAIGIAFFVGGVGLIVSNVTLAGGLLAQSFGPQTVFAVMTTAVAEAERHAVRSSP
jgi:hypothetical protein